VGLAACDFICRVVPYLGPSATTAGIVEPESSDELPKRATAQHQAQVPFVALVLSISVSQLRTLS